MLRAALGAKVNELIDICASGDPACGTTAIVNVSWPAPTLVIESSRRTSAEEPPAPKLTDVGKAVAVALSAASTFIRPAPVCCTGAVPSASGTRLALLMSSDRYWRSVRPGRAPITTAIPPAVIGEEKLVPSTIA